MNAGIAFLGTGKKVTKHILLFNSCVFWVSLCPIFAIIKTPFILDLVPILTYYDLNLIVSLKTCDIHRIWVGMIF